METSKSPKEVIPLLIEDNHHKKMKCSKCSKFIVLLFAALLLIGVCVIIVVLLNKDDESLSVGIFGKFGMHGGNIKNQQVSINSKITAQNIDSLQQICDFNATNSLAFSGYITVDDEEHAYFGDNAGYITCIDINSCSLIWRIKISDVVNNTVDLPESASRNTLSLFQDKIGNKGILFGTPNDASHMTNHKLFNYPCYAIALNIKDGSLMWKTIIANNSDSSQCEIHGFVIDKQYAFGGMSSFDYWFPPNPKVIFRGKVFKLNINNGQIIHEWYSTPIQQNREIDGYYSGCGIWPIHQIIDNYFVFGTGNLYNYPFKVEQCLLGNISSIPLTDSHPYNPCGEDMSHILKWRCLEKDIHTDSLIILDKNTFEIKTGIPFAGVDAWGDYCFDIWYNSTMNISTEPYCPKVPGRDTDAVSIATYHHNNIAYAAVGDKSGRFYIVEIVSGNVKVSKKVGPWAILGGITPFSMAIDEENMIGMITIRGASYPTYKYKMGDGTIVCDGGSVHAIDLHTGHTIWQWINPYSRIEDGNIQCNDTGYDDIIFLDNTNDGMCERSFNGSSMLFANETVINVVIPPIHDLLQPLNSIYRAINNGIVTISNGMVAIPTNTGEVFIHNITNGNHIKTLQCPDYKVDTGNNTFVWNRQGIRSGITIFDDKLIYFCGVITSEGDGHVIVYQLNQWK